jgi:hypothetical protein
MIHPIYLIVFSALVALYVLQVMRDEETALMSEAIVRCEATWISLRGPHGADLWLQQLRTQPTTLGDFKVMRPAAVALLQGAW